MSLKRTSLQSIQ